MPNIVRLKTDDKVLDTLINDVGILIISNAIMLCQW